MKSSAVHAASVLRVTAERRTDSPWVAVDRPRLSWVVEAEGAWSQSWAEIRSGDDSIRLETAESVLVDWPFQALLAGQSRSVQVRVGDQTGRETDWSEPLTVRAAFTDDWIGQPIALADPDTIARPALFRRRFAIDRPVRRAVLHSSAMGAADYAVNGSVLDDSVLGPGWTSYEHRLIYDSTDVTDRLAIGENVITARLGGLWYTEEYHVLTPPKRHHGDQPRLIAQLEIEFEDGTSTMLGTDTEWRAIADPALTASGMYAGEVFDAGAELPGWEEPEFADDHWASAVVIGEIVRPEARETEPVRRIERVPVREVLRSSTGAVIVDFGQNLVGRLAIRVRGKRGTRITMRHAEVLDDGELLVRPLRLARAVDEYILSGEGEESWEPRFTFHGFRYAEITGWPGDFDPADVEAIVLHSDFRRTGWFSSSDTTLNRFHENIVWTMRGNYLSVPMDCPQRDERLGWTGDTQLFAPTAAFLFDSQAFLHSWLRDLRLEQRRNNGIVPLFAPTVVPDFADRGPIAAWGDAIALIPHTLHRATGDAELLREFLPAMVEWLDAVIAVLDDDGLWTAGRQLGDWLDPSAPPNAPARGRTDSEIVATAYFVRTARLVASIAREFGQSEVAERLSHAAERSRKAYVQTYISPGGRMMCDTQTAYAVTIAFDLVTDTDLRRRLGDRLAQVVRRDGYHIATGLIGTAVVAKALTMSGAVDAAERLLFQTESPSWLFPVTVGATTVWERWDGLQPDGTPNPGGMVSFNHVALGSVAEWLHEEVAGLAPAEPGYRVIRIAPTILHGLDHASAQHDTPYGLASSGWHRDGESITISARVPANTTAVVQLPDGREFAIDSGTHEWVVRDEAPPASDPVDLDSSMAELADNPAAYKAFYAALARSKNRFVARSVRNNALYRETLTLRDALVFTDDATLADVRDSLAGAAESQT